MPHAAIIKLSPSTTPRWLTGLSVGPLLLMCSGLAQGVSLAGTEWRPLRMGELTVPAESSAFVRFRSKGRLIGHSGCNRLLADYHADNGVIFIGPVSATRMLCSDSVMVTEAGLAAALEQARSYRRQITTLVFYNAAGTPVLELRQTDWD